MQEPIGSGGITKPTALIHLLGDLTYKVNFQKEPIGVSAKHNDTRGWGAPSLSSVRETFSSPASP